MQVATDSRRRERLTQLGILESPPMGYVDGLSLYEFVTSNPATLTDPMGEATTRPTTFPTTNVVTIPVGSIPMKVHAYGQNPPADKRGSSEREGYTWLEYWDFDTKKFPSTKKNCVVLKYNDTKAEIGWWFIADGKGENERHEKLHVQVWEQAWNMLISKADTYIDKDMTMERAKLMQKALSRYSDGFHAAANAANAWQDWLRDEKGKVGGKYYKAWQESEKKRIRLLKEAEELENEAKKLP